MFLRCPVSRGVGVHDIHLSFEDFHFLHGREKFIDRGCVVLAVIGLNHLQIDFVQSCVKTFLLSFENHSKSSTFHTKLHYGTIFRPAIPETWQECFTLLCASVWFRTAFSVFPLILFQFYENSDGSRDGRKKMGTKEERRLSQSQETLNERSDRTRAN